ncbi:hypothetical protein HanRHA438_Chr17g0806621 [Helianthus annuus]|nr:hypothetical protein HanIR_Chr17g0864131 [Helianthus annuus]KAJ0825749.1 hypothetical protein HanRHA438_Chr17g0806621 [Helianthus annuus]
MTTKSESALTTLLTIFCFASSLTAHRSEKRIIFSRCFAMLAFEFWIVDGDGNSIFQARVTRLRKLMFMALNRKLLSSLSMVV